MVKGRINSRERIKGALPEFVNEINSPGEKGKEGGREKKYPRISTQIPTQIPICCCTNSEIVFCAKNNRDTSNKRVTHFSKSLVHARTLPPSSHDTQRSVGRFLDIFEPPPTTLQTGRFTRTREDVRGWGEDEGEDRALSPVDDVRRLVDREREEPDGTRNGAISRRLHSDKALNALMGRPIETSHLTSSASALVALYGLLLFASTSEHRPDRPFRYLPLCPRI